MHAELGMWKQKAQLRIGMRSVFWPAGVNWKSEKACGAKNNSVSTILNYQRCSPFWIWKKISSEEKKAHIGYTEI